MKQLVDYYFGLLNLVAGPNWKGAIFSLQLGLALVAVLSVVYAVAAWRQR